ncbi:olfactory receptor 13D1-like [Monodelphis domestica]|uniref:olfactory receptor 13D1-like n=1 Tax=Monodelphis domestica TaxID=13616 RepID=UPI0024E1C78A|nr:olfactory receptor 13D1-like [Monodelphis domestica]
MEKGNYTPVTEFFMMGLSNYPELQVFLYVLCLLMYLVILLGNGTLLIITILDPRLHTPMYFFLGNLSFLDICYTSSSIPQMLVNFTSERKSITFIRCALQMIFALGLGCTECLLLAVMGFDRFVAICHPLRYTIIMNKGLCVQMAAWTWTLGFLVALVQSGLALILPFCDNIIDHLFCEIVALLKLSCVDIFVMRIAGIFVLIAPLLLIFFSYVFILFAILKIKSTEGRKKAFSTCSAHLTVVILFYGSALFMYMKPKSKGTKLFDELFGLSYWAFTPMLNPIIYSLRNKEVKGAVEKVIIRKLFLKKF